MHASRSKADELKFEKYQIPKKLMEHVMVD